MGTIASGVERRRAETVHPHGRGDNLCEAAPATNKYGSPPRAWGQYRLRSRTRRRRRFTPTGVGTISTILNTWLTTTVHPHGRGDNACGIVGIMVGCGSPPRAWGQCPNRPKHSISVRFTPTGVGTIEYQALRLRRRAVHPHGRGDNLTRQMCGLLRHGSPPRAWGQFTLVWVVPLQ